MWSFHSVIFFRTLFWGKNTWLVFLGKKKNTTQFNFFTNAFLLHPVYVLREAYFHWRLCWAWNTVLNIAGVILIYIQAVYSWDSFVSGEHRLKQFIDFKKVVEEETLRTDIVFPFESKRQIFAGNHEIPKWNFIVLPHATLSCIVLRLWAISSILELMAARLGWKCHTGLWGEEGFSQHNKLNVGRTNN